MFKTTQNIAKLDISLVPEGPFLIKSRDSLDPTRPDMEFVRIVTPYGETPYVPGSSVKGVVRSSMESLIRSVGLANPGKVKPDICNPLGIREREDCGSNAGSSDLNKHCDVCKLFGSTKVAGRVHIGDLMPWSISDSIDDRRLKVSSIQKYINARPGVAIDRKTGGSTGGALFEMETLCGGEFFGEVVLENYGLWQLGLMILMFNRVDDGTLHLGFGKSRGLGRVRLIVNNLTIQQYGKLAKAPFQLKSAVGIDNSNAIIGVSGKTPSVNAFEARVEFTDTELTNVLKLLIATAAKRYE